MEPLVVTVTPSPSIDWTVRVAEFELDAINQITAEHREASGKGLNVAVALDRAGTACHAVFPAGGHSARFMATALDHERIRHTIVDTEREVRTNITLLAPGSSTKLNQPGTILDSAHLDELFAATITASQSASVVLLCGSLPLGTPTDFLGRLVTAITDCPVYVDTSGEPLEHAITHHPDLIKPNVHELADLTGMPLRNLADVMTAAEQVRSRGVGTVLASLGADGALLVDGDEPLLATAVDTPFVNSVGAGDALLAGYALGAVQERSRRARLELAALWATSAVAAETTTFHIHDQFSDHITTGPIADAGTRLTEPSVPLR